MITGRALRLSMLRASPTGGVSRPMAGPLPPACEVEKNTGSIWSKSRSSRMRCTSTDPTIPRHPTMPTLSMAMILEGFPHRVAHLCGADATHSVGVDIGGAQSVTQHPGHRRFDARGRLL